MALWVRFATVLAAICGISAVLLLILYASLRTYLVQKKRASRASTNSCTKPANSGKQTMCNGDAFSGGKETTRRLNDGGVAAGTPVSWTRGPEVLKREDELKRDTLHIFRRLEVAVSPAEKAELCKQAVELYDDISNRVGTGMPMITSGRIVFCNALMECGGLDALRDCQESREPHATALVERVVPIIFST